jgi:hypothetical protein
MLRRGLAWVAGLTFLLGGMAPDVAGASPGSGGAAVVKGGHKRGHKKGKRHGGKRHGKGARKGHARPPV